MLNVGQFSYIRPTLAFADMETRMPAQIAPTSASVGFDDRFGATSISALGRLETVSCLTGALTAATAVLTIHSTLALYGFSGRADLCGYI